MFIISQWISQFLENFHKVPVSTLLLLDITRGQDYWSRDHVLRPLNGLLLGKVNSFNGWYCFGLKIHAREILKSFHGCQRTQYVVTKTRGCTFSLFEDFRRPDYSQFFTTCRSNLCSYRDFWDPERRMSVLNTWTIPSDPGFQTRRSDRALVRESDYNRVRARVKPEAMSIALKSQGSVAQLFNPYAKPHSFGTSRSGEETNIIWFIICTGLWYLMYLNTKFMV